MTDQRTILFDLDGTLIDTTRLILACFEHSWQTVTGRRHVRETLIATFGMPLREAVSLLAADRDCNLDGDQVERLLSEDRSFNLANHDGMIRRFPGTRQAVAELKARGYLSAYSRRDVGARSAGNA